MQGYKTYTGLVVSFLGFLGIASFFSDAELAKLADVLLQLCGLLFAAYGRHVAKLK